MKKRIPTRQVNIRMQLKHLEILHKAADILEKSQVEVMGEALEMYARRKKIPAEQAAS